MVRVKRGTTALKRRRNVLAKTKGYRWGRSKKEKQAKEAMLHAGNHAFAHRRKKKGDFRKLWTVKINSEVRKHGISYSQFINKLQTKNIKLNRKVLAEIAEQDPVAFERLVKQVIS